MKKDSPISTDPVHHTQRSETAEGHSGLARKPDGSFREVSDAAATPVVKKSGGPVPEPKSKR